jgi:hypothetical protein
MKPQSRRLPILLTILMLFCLPGVILAGVAPQDQTIETNRDLHLEGFELLFPPSGWAIIHLGETYQWQPTSAATHSGARAAMIRSGGAGLSQDEWLVTAPLDFSSTVAPKLEWYEEENNWSLGDHHYIAVSTTSQTDPEAFTMVHTMTPSTHSVPGFGGAPVTVDLSAYAGEPTVYVAFRYVGENADWWIIDDVRVFELLGHDIMPLAVAPADNHFEDGATIDPVVTVYNNGEQSESFDVTLEILESDTPVYSETLSVLALGSDSELPLSFPSYPVSGGKLYKLVATTSLDSDENSLNNTVTSYNESYTQTHTPLGLLFTNAGCGPCVQANQALDSYMPTQGNDIALIRLHVSWPGADIMYNANSAQSNYMVTDYGVGGVPAFYLDGAEKTNSGAAFPGLFAQAKLGKVPMQMDLRFDPELEQTIVTVKNLEQMREDIGPLKLRVVITEDNVFYAGSNGETHHSQAMRYIFPDVYGLDVPTTLGDHQFVVDTPLNGSWVYDNLRATVFLQDMGTRTVLQSGTGFLTDIDEATSPVQDQMARPYQLAANYPNPFNPSTTISFKLPRNEQAELVIYSIDGARVATLVNEQMAEGAHSVTWTGQNDAGQQVASGTYFYQLRTPSFSETRMMTLIK